jgi:hypothetical protein
LQYKNYEHPLYLHQKEQVSLAPYHLFLRSK